MEKQGQTIGTSIIMKFVERFGTQIVNIILNIILARLLAPEDYGVLAILNVFVVLAQVISQNGINNALIQKDNPDHLDYSTALDISLAIAGAIYLILFWLARPIAGFYDMPEISLYLKVLALELFPGAINAIYNAKVMKNMQFRIVMITGMVANISSCILGVIAAYCGLGVWSLIISQMSATCILLLMMGIMVKGNLSMKFSKEKAKSLMNYGNKIIIASVIDNLYYDVEGLLIGKILSKEILGYFTNARTYPLRVVSSIKDTIAGVVFPALANEQSNLIRMKEIARKSIQIFSFIMFPMLFGFAAISREFVCILLTEKWLPCLMPMRAFCIGFTFLSLSAPNIQIIKAIGKSDLNLKVELVRKVIIFLGLIISSIGWGTIEAISFASMLTTITTALMVASVGGKTIDFSLREQLKVVMGNIIATVGMLITIYIISIFSPDKFFGYVSLIIKILVGGSVYIGIAIITKNASMQIIIKKIKILIAKYWKGLGNNE